MPLLVSFYNVLMFPHIIFWPLFTDNSEHCGSSFVFRQPKWWEFAFVLTKIVSSNTYFLYLAAKSCYSIFEIVHLQCRFLPISCPFRGLLALEAVLVTEELMQKLCATMCVCAYMYGGYSGGPSICERRSWQTQSVSRFMLTCASFFWEARHRNRLPCSLGQLYSSS